jgi:invasion protein IalB
VDGLFLPRKDEDMLLWNSALIYPAIIALAMSGRIAIVQAQKSDVPATGSGWRVDCNNNGKALDCRAFIDAVQRDKPQIIVSISVRYVAEAKKPVMIVQVPLGILVTEALAVSVDSDQPDRFVIETCTPAGCFAGSAISDALIAKMRAGKEVKIVFDNVNRKPITVTMPLVGFGVAYDKIKG